MWGSIKRVDYAWHAAHAVVFIGCMLLIDLSFGTAFKWRDPVAWPGVVVLCLAIGDFSDRVVSALWREKRSRPA
jgi:hypothetical protein